MARGKAQKKSSMRGKRGLDNGRALKTRETGKKVAGETGMRSATSGRSEGQVEEPARRPPGAATGASKGARRPRKSDI